MNQKQISKKIEDAIWEVIRDDSDNEPFEWEVTFNDKKGKRYILNNDTIYRGW